ncbi:hypothetical protein Tco_1105212 [Tanacetum coccineum]
MVAAGGNIMRKTPQEAYDLIENMTQHHFQWDAEVYYDTTTSVSAHHSETTSVFGAQIEVLGKQTAYTIQSVQHQPRPGHPNTVYYSNDSDESGEDEPSVVLNIQKPIHSLSGNPTPSSDSVVESIFPLLTPFGDSDSLLEETDTLLSHIDDSFPEYETFCFNIEEKSSGSTTTHSDYSLPDYEAFYFDDNHIEEKSSGSTTSHSGLSLPEYDSFIFDLSIDPFPPADRSVSHYEEFADELTHIISPSKYDRFYFDLEIVLGEFTSVVEKNIHLIYHRLRILQSFQISLKKFPTISFKSYPLFLTDSPEIDTLTSFPSGNEDKVFNPGILTSKGFHSRYSLRLSHRDSEAFKINKKFKSPMEIFPFFFLYYGGDVSSLDVPYLHFYPP